MGIGEEIGLIGQAFSYGSRGGKCLLKNGFWDAFSAPLVLRPKSAFRILGDIYDFLIPRKDFGSWLKNFRLRRGIRQVDLARMLGIHKVSLHRYEKNVSRPSKALSRNYWLIWRPRFVASSRREEGAMPQRIVTDRATKKSPEDGPPRRAGVLLGCDQAISHGSAASGSFWEAAAFASLGLRTTGGTPHLTMLWLAPKSPPANWSLIS